MPVCEYIWIDGQGGLRSKGRTCEGAPGEWNFDGSSTGQAGGVDSEITLIPVASCLDPFRGGGALLVLCDCRTPSGEPAKGNWRSLVAPIFEEYSNLHPWYGLEQEYFLYDGEWPLGWDRKQAPQGPYYCGVGADRVFGREIAEEHYRLALQAGLKISGINGEVAPGQWEFQVGPCEGLEGADQMWFARYILLRTAEQYGLTVSFDPKPLEGDWNGSGMHTNFSTKEMREEDGIQAINRAVVALSERHQEHLEVYGTNDKRLTGLHETSSRDRFSWGIGSRTTSVRIPNQVARERRGYFEDRRPASDADPYRVCAILLETVALGANQST